MKKIKRAVASAVACLAVGGAFLGVGGCTRPKDEKTQIEKVSELIAEWYADNHEDLTLSYYQIITLNDTEYLLFLNNYEKGYIYYFKIEDNKITDTNDYFVKLQR